MPKSENQKLKLLYLADLFKKKTDENHAVTMADILAYMDSLDISVTRKTIYSDIDALRDYGMDIEGYQKDNTYYYRLLGGEFELAELKLLVDAVQSSKFITLKKSNELIKKLEGLVSVYEAGRLQTQVFVNERVKTMNESIYYNVDTLNEAINMDSSIDFNYYEWNVNKQLVLKKNGAKKDISPWCLVWDDENYYMVAFDADANMIKHYRVDKMREIVITGTKRKGRDVFKKEDTAIYTKKVFGMFGGNEENVTIEFENRLVGVVIDRFGKDVMMIPVDDGHFRIHVDVEVSSMFISWVMGLGKGAVITGPKEVVDRVREEILRMYGEYFKEVHKES